MVETTPGQGDLARLSEAATPGLWTDFHLSPDIGGDKDADGWTTVARSPCPSSPPSGARRKRWDADRAFIVALVNAYRAGTIAPLGSSAASVREAAPVTFSDETQRRRLSATVGPHDEDLARVISDADMLHAILSREPSRSILQSAVEDTRSAVASLAAAPALAPVAEERGQVETLRDACKPWEFHLGDPPPDDSPLSGVFGAGMAYSEALLAKRLDVEAYERGDGSEDFDQDATKTLENILIAAGLYDPEDGRWATLSPAPTEPEREGQDQGATLAGDALEHGYRCQGALALIAASGDDVPAWKLRAIADEAITQRSSPVGRPSDAPEITTETADSGRPAAGSDGGWHFDMDAAPRDGSKVDLMFPYPRGRTVNCFYGDSALTGGDVWLWREPTWGDGELLPESRWKTGCYINMQPYAWRLPDEPDDRLSPSSDSRQGGA